jgi:flagella basal body P-ring formation protein FlgA
MPDRIADSLPADPPKNGEKSWQLPRRGKLAIAALRHAAAFVAFAAALTAAFAARSATSEPLTQATLETIVTDFVQNQTAGLSDAVRIEVTWPTDASRLPPCTVAAPELPPGQRLWGRISVTLRCLAPQPWQINIPVLVRRFGSYVVTTRALRLRSEVTTADLSVQEGEMTFLPEDLVRTPDEAAGKIVRVGIAAGQPLRSAWLETPIAIRNGDTVKVIYQGAHFRVETEGRAMNGAAVGERVRVRLGNGQVVEGVAARAGVVHTTQ